MLATKLTLGSLDVSRIAKLVVTRRKGVVRTLKQTAELAHFLRNHANDELSEYQGGWATVKTGVDYVSVQIVAK